MKRKIVNTGRRVSSIVGNSICYLDAGIGKNLVSSFMLEATIKNQFLSAADNGRRFSSELIIKNGEKRNRRSDGSLSSLISICSRRTGRQSVGLPWLQSRVEWVFIEILSVLSASSVRCIIIGLLWSASPQFSFPSKIAQVRTTAKWSDPRPFWRETPSHRPGVSFWNM